MRAFRSGHVNVSVLSRMLWCAFAHQEEELRAAGDAKYDHLNEDLHVLVEAKGTENIAAARLAAGVAEVRKMLIPGVSTGFLPLYYYFGDC